MSRRRAIGFFGLLLLASQPGAGPVLSSPVEAGDASSTAVLCQPITASLSACPDEDTLEAWARANQVAEPAEAELAVELDPPDPLPIRDGLEVYEELLTGAARYTRTSLDLWEHTPLYAEAELAWFRSHPRVWEAVVAIHAAPPRARSAALRAALAAVGSDRLARRHLVLRNGLLYFEDRPTAVWAVRHLRVGDLFDEPLVELWRNGEQYLLARDERGEYRHIDPAFEGYRARLHLLDRVGLPDTLEPLPSYDLAGLRRELGLDYLEVGAEGPAGRAGTAVFLSGERLPARLVRLAPNQRMLAVVADTPNLHEILRRSARHAQAIEGLLGAATAMVRERLFFDEPPNEVGQQDGIMRPAFEAAVARGDRTYVVNGVRIDAYDEHGRAQPPQVCVDFLTDAVERFGGRWWPPAGTVPAERSGGRIDIRRYMPERRAEDLLDLGERRPHVAALLRFGADDLVPYRQSDAFFENIWRHRDDIRRGDAIIIYGLRADGRNHFHSFYISNTDPIHGVPIEITDNAGEARTRSWHEVMSSSPRRSIRYRVRWNPGWLEQPDAVDGADGVVERARRAAESMQLPSLPVSERVPVGARVAL